MPTTKTTTKHHELDVCGTTERRNHPLTMIVRDAWLHAAHQKSPSSTSFYRPFPLAAPIASDCVFQEVEFFDE